MMSKPVCHRVQRIGTKQIICLGFTKKPIEGIPEEDLIHFCTFTNEEAEKVKGKGICPNNRMSLHMTPSEALTIGVNFIRTVALSDLEKEMLAVKG